MIYPKINSIFKRDSKSHKMLFGEFSTPEFEYLKDNEWVGYEKIDGTNIRWELNPSWTKPGIWGRTDNAQVPAGVVQYLSEREDAVKSVFTDPVILFGEGCGRKIQKGGGNYCPDGNLFVLFDVFCGGLWLRNDGVVDIALKIGVPVARKVFSGTLLRAVEFLREEPLKSWFGNFDAEGMVLKPSTMLFDRRGNRIVTKIKTRDFA